MPLAPFMRKRIADNQLIQTVNGLVKKSFGFLCKGNYHICPGFDGSLGQRDCLEVIARPTLGDPQFGCGVKGLLGSNKFEADGSAIIVIRKYEKKARKYAELFEKEFGRKVTVKLVNDFYELFPYQDLMSRAPMADDFDFIPRQQLKQRVVDWTF